MRQQGMGNRGSPLDRGPQIEHSRLTILSNASQRDGFRQKPTRAPNSFAVLPLPRPAGCSPVPSRARQVEAKGPGRIELLLLLPDLSGVIHGKRAVKLTAKRPVSKPLRGCAKNAHVLGFPHHEM